MRVLVCTSAIVIVVVSAVWNRPTHAAEQRPTTRPYPLETCVVSGERLGEMGKPNIIHYHDREVRLCCKDCEKDFKKDPEKYLKKLDAATTKPAATQPSHDGDQGHAGHDRAHMRQR